MGILKKIRDKTGTVHDLGDSRVDAFETELSGAARNVPYSPAVLGKANAIEKKIDDHAANVANPHGVTKEQLGLANVENKSSTQIRSEITKENVTNALGYTPIDESRIGAANGVASLDAGGRIPASQIPGGFDNIDEYDSLADFPETGEEGKIYVAKDTNLTYRWTGSQYVEISPSLALGETATTAYRGDRGKAAYDHSQISGDSTIHHTHANKELLDSYKQTEADLANAVAKVHEHGNKAVLDGITADKVSEWDSKQQALTFDSTPTAGSTNPVTSGGIRTAINDIVIGKTGKVTSSATVNAGQVALMASFDYSSTAAVNMELVGTVSFVLNDGLVEKTRAANFIINISASKRRYTLTIDNPLCYGMIKFINDTESKKIDFYIVAPVSAAAWSAAMMTVDSIRTSWRNNLDPTSLMTYTATSSPKSWSSDVPEWTPWFSEICGMSAGSESVPVYLENGIAKEATGVATKAELEAQGNVILTYGETPTQTFEELLEIQKKGKLYFKSNNDIALAYYGNTDQIIAIFTFAEAHAVRRLRRNLTWEQYTNTLQQALTFDEAPTAGSTNPVTSGGIKTAINAESTARSDADSALGSRISTLEGKTKLSDFTDDITTGTYSETGSAPVNGQAVASAVGAEATARSEADAALGGRIDAVDARGLTVKEIDGEQVLCFE